MADDVLVSIAPDLAQMAQSLKRLEDLAAKQGKEFGEELGKNAEQSMNKQFKKLLGIGAAVGAVLGGKALFGAMIDNAKEGETAVQRLNTSLKLAGTYSAESSQRMQDLANSLQQTSIYNSDVIIAQEALARNFTKTNEQAEQLTRAAVDLSAATGMSLDSAVKNLGKTFAGLTGELGESLPALRNLSPAALKAGAALDFVIQRFGGASAAMVNTFGGALAVAENGFKTLLKEAGNLITKSPVVIALIREISSMLFKWSDATKEMGKNDWIGNMIKKTLEFGQILSQWVLPPIELLYNGFKSFILLFSGAIQEFVIIPLTAAANVVGKVGNYLGAISDETAQTLDLLNQSAQQSLTDINTMTEDSLNNMFNFDTSVAASDFVSRLQQVAESAKPVVDEMKNSISEIPDGLITVGESFQMVVDGMNEAAADFNEKAAANFKKVGSTMFQALGQGAGQAFAAFGKAVAKGENALDAFLNAMLASFGQAMVQMGTMYILQGIAATWAGQPNGPPLIAAGAALAAFGGVLMALGGGGGESAGASGGASGSASGASSAEADGTGTQDIADAEPRGPQTSITVQVQGNVLDRRQTGLELAEVIQETFGTNGIVYNT